MLSTTAWRHSQRTSTLCGSGPECGVGCLASGDHFQINPMQHGRREKSGESSLMRAHDPLMVLRCFLTSPTNSAMGCGSCSPARQLVLQNHERIPQDYLHQFSENQGPCAVHSAAHCRFERGPRPTGCRWRLATTDQFWRKRHPAPGTPSPLRTPHSDHCSQLHCSRGRWAAPTSIEYGVSN